ncbi:MAG: TRAP transporter permease, partial [Deltaproteobacteria bacterium]|nr:TRAP transporter permease [Deltaproteobacteria bacterium]
MKTAFTSWKLAKGLYILPVVMAYHPLLLNGPTGEVVQTVIFCTLSIIAFVVCMERYCLTPLSWAETVLFGGSGILLIWAGDTINFIGLVIFILLMAYQVIRYRKQPPRKKLRR